MKGTEKFCLQWSEFEASISDGFRELREKKDFFDVTLACEDKQVQAHRVIISACSPFFNNVLRRNPHQHPLLYLKGVKYKELLSILDFMYMGEVNLPQEELNSFLAVAEELSVKGLTKNKQSAQPIKRQNLNKEETSPPLKSPKRGRKLTPQVTDFARIADAKTDEVDKISDEQTEAFKVPFQESTLHQTALSNQTQTENENSKSFALNNSYVVDDTFENCYEETSDMNSLAGMNIKLEGTDGNKGTQLQYSTNLENSSTQEDKLLTKPKAVRRSENKTQLDTTQQQVTPSPEVTASLINTKKVVTSSSKPRQTANKVKRQSVEEKPGHSYKRFGSAWQCEQCKTLFSRKSYAMEHMEEENKNTSRV